MSGTSTEEDDVVNLDALCHKPLANLLDDYGEQDLDWRNKLTSSSGVEPKQTMRTDATISTIGDDDQHHVNRLERHGKAPVHVEFFTFGYRHGIPGELRSASTGNNHTLPLPAFDCRCIQEVPQYLSWMDGTSGAVRNALLRQQNNNSNKKAGGGDNNEAVAAVQQHVRDYANTVVACAVANAVATAIDQGGHGYALPLRMVVYLGSESGRHRSVVCAELAATALRKMLRQNANDKFKAPVSVGTRHRDIHTQQQQKNRSNCSSVKVKKQKGLEDGF
jgi:hypothetical protein